MPPADPDALPPSYDPFASARAEMVATQIVARGVTHPRVLAALRKVPRHAFVAPSQARLAYGDSPLSIGHGQTISQPYIVAWMTELAAPEPGARVLDVGTGSGYQAAVLAELVTHAGSIEPVRSIEIVCALADSARERLKRLGYTNVEVRCGDGWQGWPEHAPYDVIILAAAPETVPPALLEQLAPGGRLVLPVGPQASHQELRLIRKRADGTLDQADLGSVRFVPMTGSPAPPGR